MRPAEAATTAVRYRAIRLADQAAAPAVDQRDRTSLDAGNLHPPCAGEMDDAAVGSRRDHQRDVRTDRAAEYQTRPAVEAMGSDGPHGVARPTAVRRVGELGGEELLEETRQRVSVKPQCSFAHLILPWDRSARTGSWSDRAQALRAGRQLAPRTPSDRRRRCAAALSVPAPRP